MGLKLEVGKYYKTRDGRKVGPMLIWNEEADFPFSDHMTCGTSVWAPDGSNNGSQSEIIAEWTADDAAPGPVRTVTRKEIVPGVYGDVEVAGDDTYQGGIGIYINATMNAARIRAAANSMLAVADAMEDV